METFSQRMGLVPKREELQLRDIDQRLRNALWNVLLRAGIADHPEFVSEVVDLIWSDHLGLCLDATQGYLGSYAWFRDRFTAGEWFEVYDTLEVVLHAARQPSSQLPTPYHDLREAFNRSLELECSAYRVIDGKVTPVASPADVEAVSGALDATEAHGLDAPQAHLAKANGFLAQRPEPDCANAIKEAVTAVESLCSTLTAERHRGLKPGLDELENKGVALHGALKKGMESLYGWASDDSGIRHGGPAAPSVELAEARFAVVICSSVVTFMVDKARVAGLL